MPFQTVVKLFVRCADNEKRFRTYQVTDTLKAVIVQSVVRGVSPTEEWLPEHAFVKSEMVVGSTFTDVFVRGAWDISNIEVLAENYERIIADKKQRQMANLQARLNKLQNKGDSDNE